MNVGIITSICAGAYFIGFALWGKGGNVGEAWRNAFTADDVNGLARCLASEASVDDRYTHEERIAIAWCALNWCEAVNYSVSTVMLPPHHQRHHWCSTIAAPSAGDIALALGVMEDFNNGGIDPTKGAISFFEPAEEDREFKAGVAGVLQDAAGLRQRWAKEGLTLTEAVGRFEFYKRK